MKISIKRYQNSESYSEEFNIEKKVTTLLAALYAIRSNNDSTFTFESGCRSGVCGACAVRVNGREVLACSYTPKDGDIVEPLQYHKVLRDLKVDKNTPKNTIKRADAHLHHYSGYVPAIKDEEKTNLQSDCILCDSCYSACPVYAVKADFLGPFALTRAWRYVADSREEDNISIISSIQSAGVWDCTLCGECTAVCPKGIDPKNDILQLRSKSMQAGYSDPNFSTMSFL